MLWFWEGGVIRGEVFAEEGASVVCSVLIVRLDQEHQGSKIKGVRLWETKQKNLCYPAYSETCDV